FALREHARRAGRLGPRSTGVASQQLLLLRCTWSAHGTRPTCPDVRYYGESWRVSGPERISVTAKDVPIGRFSTRAVRDKYIERRLRQNLFGDVWPELQASSNSQYKIFSPNLCRCDQKESVGRSLISSNP